MRGHKLRWHKHWGRHFRALTVFEFQPLPFIWLWENKLTSCSIATGRFLSRPSRMDMPSAFQSLRLLCARVSSVAMPRGSHSPFFPVLAGAVEELPGVLHDQYLLQPEDPYRVVLEGTMDRIWHRPFWLWPFLRLCALFDILFPEQGSDIEASMIVEGRHDKQGGGAQTWNRTFWFRKPRQFNATMVFDLCLARVVERMAPFGILEVIWNVAFEPPDTIRIETCGMRVGMNRLRIMLPRWASVEVRVSETALLESNETIEVTLALRHPSLGEIFGYTGRFRVRRELKEECRS